MEESRYDKYVVRKPGRLVKGRVAVPDNINTVGLKDTGPIVWIEETLMKNSKAGLEAGIISGDVAVGTGRNPRFTPHKHNYDEIFSFFGTNPDDPLELGAEVEFWMGEGKTLDKVVITSSASIYVPAMLAHFPMIWKNVKKPCIFVAVICASGKERDANPYIDADMEGRPTDFHEGKTWANI